MHHNARIFCIISGFMLMLLSCTGSGKSNNNGSQDSNIAVADSAEQGKDPLAHLIHNGTSDTIYEVVTQVYAARQDGDTIIKDGKPSFDREFSAFPNEDTCIYDTSGRIDSVRGTADGIHYKYVYGYDGKKLSDERYYQNGELFYDRRYIYNRDVRVNTIEELYIGGSKTINEYPIDLSKVRYKDGNRIEFGETPSDYTITDSRGNVIKESSYSSLHLRLHQHRHPRQLDKGRDTLQRRALRHSGTLHHLLLTIATHPNHTKQQIYTASLPHSHRWCTTMRFHQM